MTTFAPSDDHLRFIASNCGWTDPTPDDLRCLWVVERYLAESNHRFYHLTHPYMRPFPGGMETLTFGGIDSYDGAGLAALTVAAFAAAVRVEIRPRNLFFDMTDEEPRYYWDEDDVPAKPFSVTFVIRDQRVGFERFATREELDERLDDLNATTGATIVDERDDDTDRDEDEIGRRSELSIMLHPRQRSAPGVHMFERHPGLDYLTDMIAKYTPEAP